MNRDDRQSLRLAARLIEAGAVPSGPPPASTGGHVWNGLFLASRLQSILGPEGAARAAERLRTATS